MLKVGQLKPILIKLPSYYKLSLGQMEQRQVPKRIYKIGREPVGLLKEAMARSMHPIFSGSVPFLGATVSIEAPVQVLSLCC
jgi:hypothetical protein